MRKACEKDAETLSILATKKGLNITQTFRYLRMGALQAKIRTRKISEFNINGSDYNFSSQLTRDDCNMNMMVNRLAVNLLAPYTNFTRVIFPMTPIIND